MFSGERSERSTPRRDVLCRGSRSAGAAGRRLAGRDRRRTCHRGGAAQAQEEEALAAPAHDTLM